MKKIIIFLFLLSLIFIISYQENEYIIPNDAIRFRIIANSNSLKDQQEKLIIQKRIEETVYNIIGNANTSKEVRLKLQKNMNIIENTLNEYQIPYHVYYGSNFFPTKNYKGVLYPAGEYESLVITLGKGLGSNFWCVLSF